MEADKSNIITMCTGNKTSIW